MTGQQNSEEMLPEFITAAIHTGQDSDQWVNLKSNVPLIQGLNKGLVVAK